MKDTFIMFPRMFALLTITAIASSLLDAHEEPPKTMKERMEQERERKQIAARQIRTETVWRIVGSGRIRQRFSSYDRKGNLVEQSVYAADTVAGARIAYAYTPDNVIFQQTTITNADTERTVFALLPPHLIASATDFATSGYARSRLEYTYTDTLITAVKYDSADGPVYRLSYRYPGGTAYGVMAEARQEDASGRQTTRIRNVYQEDLLIEKQVHNARDSLEYVFRYTYTPTGDFDTIMKRMADGTVAFRRTYRYSLEGILRQVTEHDAEGGLRVTLDYEYELYDKGD